MNSRNVKNYLTVTFLSIISWSIIGLAVPLYMNYLGLSLSKIGLIFTIGALPVLILQVYIGHLSDIFGRKKLFLISTAIASIGSLFFAFGKNIWSFITGRLFFEGGTNIRAAASEPIIIDLHEKGKIGKPYGWFISVIHLSVFLGLVLTGFLIERIGYQNVFLVCFILGFVSLLLFSFFKEERPREKFKFSFRDISFNLKLMTCFMFLIVFGSSLLGEYAFPIFLKNVLVLPVSTIGLIFAFGALGTGIGGLFGPLGDKFGFKRINLIFLTLAGVSILLISLFTHYLIISSLWVIHGFFGGIAFSTFGYFKRAAALPERRGRDLSIKRFGNITGTILAVALAGILMERFGFKILLFISALSFFLAGIILTVFFKE